jgi:hypothetical protein
MTCSKSIYNVTLLFNRSTGNAYSWTMYSTSGTRIFRGPRLFSFLFQCLHYSFFLHRNTKMSNRINQPLKKKIYISIPMRIYINIPMRILKKFYCKCDCNLIFLWKILKSYLYIQVCVCLFFHMHRDFISPVENLFSTRFCEILSKEIPDFWYSC